MRDGPSQSLPNFRWKQMAHDDFRINLFCEPPAGSGVRGGDEAFRLDCQHRVTGCVDDEPNAVICGLSACFSNVAKCAWYGKQAGTVSAELPSPSQSGPPVLTIGRDYSEVHKQRTHNLARHRAIGHFHAARRKLTD